MCRRPSGHLVWHSQGRGWHKDRDLKALDEGAYGICPSGRCPNSIDELSVEQTYEQPAKQAKLSGY
jgi:hypothetical protein